MNLACSLFVRLLFVCLFVRRGQGVPPLSSCNLFLHFTSLDRGFQRILLRKSTFDPISPIELTRPTVSCNNSNPTSVAVVTCVATTALQVPINCPQCGLHTPPWKESHGFPSHCCQCVCSVYCSALPSCCIKEFML